MDGQVDGWFHAGFWPRFRDCKGSRLASGHLFGFAGFSFHAFRGASICIGQPVEAFLGFWGFGTRKFQHFRGFMLMPPNIFWEWAIYYRHISKVQLEG